MEGNEAIMMSSKSTGLMSLGAIFVGIVIIIMIAAVFSVSPFADISSRSLMAFSFAFGMLGMALLLVGDAIAPEKLKRRRGNIIAAVVTVAILTICVYTIFFTDLLGGRPPTEAFIGAIAVPFKPFLSILGAEATIASVTDMATSTFTPLSIISIIAMVLIWGIAIAIMIIKKGKWRTFVVLILWAIAFWLGFLCFVIPAIIVGILMYRRYGGVRTLLNILIAPIGSALGATVIK